MTVMLVEILADDELPVRALGVFTPAQRAGVRYEELVTNWLLHFKTFYPQIAFRINSQLRILDGLLYCAPDWLVVEIKTQYCVAAERQLREYQEALTAWMQRPVRALLVCGVYRPELSSLSSLSSLPVVASLAHAFQHSFSVLPLGSRNLTIGTSRYGMGLAKSTAHAAVRPSRGLGDSVDRLQCVSSVELA